MLDVFHNLYTEADGILHEEVRATSHVPRSGELAFLDLRSYQVVDVLWHIVDSEHDHVTVTACERDWHQRITDTLRAWGHAPSQ